jgi:REP element-mobilizing transposase RayT
MSTHSLIPLEENRFYHIYNRGNNGENLFYTLENYHYFLRKYDIYLSDYLETYSYCLLPNHFHLLVRIKSIENIPFKKDFPQFSETESIGKLVSERFRRFFMSYAKSIAVQTGRSGSLFQKNFRRKLVNDDAYFSHLIYYIHANPERHKITDNFKEYAYSSYRRILIDKPTKLFKNDVIEWFGKKQDYINFHFDKHDDSLITDLIIEDD